MRFVSFLIVIGMAFCYSCIDPFDIEFAESDARLVVDGMITNAPGPYTIKIYRTKPIDDQISNVDWVEKAQVWILDDTGAQEQLAEIKPGNYATSILGMQGEVGKTYTLRIQVGENIFESKPQKMEPVGEIKNLYYNFKQVEDPQTTDYINVKNGFEVFVDAEVLHGQGERMRWRTMGTFEVISYPSRKTKLQGGSGGSVVVVPDPPKCSGWIYDVRQGGLKEVGACVCCDCWITTFDEVPLLSDETFVQNGEVKGMKVGFIGASKRHFYKKFYLQIEQMSVSEDVFNFWETVKAQKQSGSDLFQTPPGKTVGNIFPVNSNETVIGVFAVSAVKHADITFLPEQIPYFMPYIDEVEESCLLMYNGIVNKASSNKKPPFW